MSSTVRGGRPTVVAFLFFSDGKDWQGGINYFHTLFLALSSYPSCQVQPIAFIGNKADVDKYGFPANVRVRRAATLDRMSLPWLLNKISEVLTGRPILTNRLLRSEGIALLSHGGPTGMRDIRNASWIADFQHLHLPHFFQPDELRKRNKLFRLIIERSDLVIVSSESARQDLLAFSSANGEKARVLRFAAIPPAVEPGKRLDLAQVYGLSGRYFYIPNQAWAHKNHLTAIEALARLKNTSDARIVCSGSLKDYRNPGHLDALRAAIERHGLSDRFLMLGMVPYSHISELMLQAVAVINPSLFEGWSTTVEESKALGVPLILSDIPVHREQCEGLPSRFFEPLDANALALAMLEAASEEPLSGDALDARLRAAQVRHARRMQQFAADYVTIVNELAGER